MDFSELRSIITDTVPWIKMSDVRVDILEERHVKLSLPIQKHLNHVGIVYAGSHFMLMELAGAALFLGTYGFKRFVPINKEMSIRYRKPADSTINCELYISEIEASEKIRPIEEKGKGEWILDMSTKDSKNNIVSTSTCKYFIMPTPENFIKGIRSHSEC